jgi:hypothetical protein
VAIALAAGLLALIAGVILARRDGAAPASGSSEATRAASRSSAGDPHVRSDRGAETDAGVDEVRAAPARAGLRAALERGVREADALGGEAAAAVWVSGDAAPLSSGPVSARHRMWSMSKAVVSIAALEAVDDSPNSVLSSALADAIRRSDNCAIRRAIVGLQEGSNRGVAGAVAAFEGVLAKAGVRIEAAPQAAVAEESCVRYLESHRGDLPGGDLGVAVQFGTAEWSMLDAIAFTHALGDGVYGAPGEHLLELMARPKEGPLEEPAPPSAPPLDWGAGAVFPSSWHPAWKAGWGGSRERPARFLAGQIVALRPDHTPVAVAAVFLPSVQPTVDNPGITQAPQALELIFSAVRSGLRQSALAGDDGLRCMSRGEKCETRQTKRG